MQWHSIADISASHSPPRRSSMKFRRIRCASPRHVARIRRSGANRRSWVFLGLATLIAASSCGKDYVSFGESEAPVQWIQSSLVADSGDHYWTNGMITVCFANGDINSDQGTRFRNALNQTWGAVANISLRFVNDCLEINPGTQPK